MKMPPVCRSDNILLYPAEIDRRHPDETVTRYHYIDHVSDDDPDSLLRFELWCKKQTPRRCGFYDALDTFKREIFRMCMDKIEADEDTEHFQKLLDKHRNNLAGKLDVEKARAVPIVHLLMQAGCERDRGGMYQSPFMPEQRTGSLSVDEERNIWYCFASSQGGDSISMIMKIKGCGFREAVKFLT